MKDLVTEKMYVLTKEEQVEICPEEAQLDKEITLPLLMQFGIPIILGMLILNGFGLADGVLSMRALGMEALATVSLMTPFFMLAMGIGMLFAAGGGAVIVRKLGQGLFAEARQNFAFTSIIAGVIALLISIVVFLFPEFVIGLLGGNDEIMEMASSYLRIAVWMLPPFVLGQFFNSFLIADGKPMLGMGLTLLNSIIGFGLTYGALFWLDLGLNALGWVGIISGIGPLLLYFYLFSKKGNKTGNFYFVKPALDFKALGEIMYNGFAVFIPMASSVLLMTFKNNVVVEIDGIGAMGLAVVGMVMGLHGLINNFFGGYLQGVGALISFNHGKGNHTRQRKLFKLNVKVFMVLSVITILIGFVFADLLVRIYVPVGTEMHTMAVRGLRMMSLSFISIGINALAGGQFTALGKGGVAVTLGLLRTVILDLGFILILPRLFGLTGVWMTMPIAEGVAVLFSIGLLVFFGKKYHYLG